MIDTQKTAVLNAITAATEHTMTELPLERACQILGVERSRIHQVRRPGMRASASHGEFGVNASPMTMLHMLSHMATPSVFPAHGAEFCENLIKVTEQLYPAAADAIRASLDAAGAHYSAEHRKRAVIKAVVQRAVDGTSRVEAIFGSPPQRVEGSFRYDRRDGTITVNSESFELERLRYLSRIS